MIILNLEAFRWHKYLMVQVDCLELDKAVFVSMEKLVVCRMSLSLLLNICKSIGCTLTIKVRDS